MKLVTISKIFIIPLVLIVYSFLPHSLASADESAIFYGCVYDEETNKPIEGAKISVQSLGAPIAGGQFTDADGCISGIYLNPEFIHGDYIEASYEVDNQIFRQQYQIPNILIDQEYIYDFYLKVKRSPDCGEMILEQLDDQKNLQFAYDDLGAPVECKLDSGDYCGCATGGNGEDPIWDEGMTEDECDDFCGVHACWAFKLYKKSELSPSVPGVATTNN